MYDQYNATTCSQLLEIGINTVNLSKYLGCFIRANTKVTQSSLKTKRKVWSLGSDPSTQKHPLSALLSFHLTFTLPLGCSSSVTDTLSCCSRLFTSLEQQTLTAPCTCDALYSENVLLSITSKRPVPLWMRLARRLMSMALRLVGPFSPAMM